MPEHGNAFLANPTAFLAANAIGVQQVDVVYAPPNWQNVDDATYNFSIRDAGGDNIPKLRMENPVVPRGVEAVVAKWCNTSQGAHAGRYDEISYCDFSAAPALGAPTVVFTGAMNGCGFVVVTAVPALAGGYAIPALAAGHLRLYHDRRLATLAAWVAAGFTVQFAAYAGAPPPGGMMPGGINVADYNPHDYLWNYTDVNGDPQIRAVTNFLAYDGVNWVFHSRHFHENGITHALSAVDTPPGVVGANSTQAINI